MHGTRWVGGRRHGARVELSHFSCGELLGKLLCRTLRIRKLCLELLQPLLPRRLRINQLLL